MKREGRNGDDVPSLALIDEIGHIDLHISTALCRLNLSSLDLCAYQHNMQHSHSRGGPVEGANDEQSSMLNVVPQSNVLRQIPVSLHR